MQLGLLVSALSEGGVLLPSLLRWLGKKSPQTASWVGGYYVEPACQGDAVDVRQTLTHTHTYTDVKAISVFTDVHEQ